MMDWNTHHLGLAATVAEQSVVADVLEAVGQTVQ